MIIVKCHNPAYYDVDDTLIMRSGKVVGAMEMRTERGSIWVKPHKPHIETLKELHAQGITIIVWSAGGSAHAAAAVEALGIEKYVDVVLEKPHWVVDDKAPESWMPKAWYKDPYPDEGPQPGKDLDVMKVTQDPKTFPPLHPKKES